MILCPKLLPFKTLCYSSMIWETKIITSSGLWWKFNESDEFMDDRGEIKDDQLETRGATIHQYDYATTHV